jgi:hypothetical protein
MVRDGDLARSWTYETVAPITSDHVLCTPPFTDWWVRSWRRSVPYGAEGKIGAREGKIGAEEG